MNNVYNRMWLRFVYMITREIYKSLTRSICDKENITTVEMVILMPLQNIRKTHIHSVSA